MNETELAEYLLIGVFVFEVIGILLGLTIGSSVANPNVTYLNGLSSHIQNQSTALSGSFNYTLMKPLSGSGFFGINALANAFILFFNILAKIVLFITNMLLLLVIGLYMVVFLLFDLLPSFLLNPALGFLGYVFGVGYGLMLILIAVFSFTLITEIWNRIIGGVHK
ncbi:MAG: hypothetical protein QXL94_06690 [Candidatus Parvarchaeum sp.]